MKVFSTSYSVDTAVYSSFVYSKDRAEADRFIMARGIGESITGTLLVDKTFDPCPLPSSYYAARKLLRCVHTLTFYGWIAGHFMNVHHELLRDDGMLHEVLHEMEHPQETCFRPLLLNRLKNLERLIPGLKTFDAEVFATLQRT